MLFRIGYKGLIFNLLLILTGALLNYFSESGLDKSNSHLPISLMILIMGVLFFERRAIQNILSVEFSTKENYQLKIWHWFSNKGFFTLLVILSLIWRCYFKLVFLLFPIIEALLRAIQITTNSTIWLSRILCSIAFLWVGYQELRLVADTIEPPKHEVSSWSEFWSRLVQLVLTGYFTYYMKVLFEQYLVSGHNNFQNIISELPLMVIFFLFFYIPIRWIELLTNVIDTKTKSSLIVFGLTTFLAMLLTFN